MGNRLRIRLWAVVATSAVLLAGCSATSLVVDGSEVVVAIPQPFTSVNSTTSYGNTAANASIVSATNAGFAYYDDEPKLVRDESFGHYEVVGDDPFTVRYTVNDDVTWSDGVPIDSADLLLAWAANSGKLSTPGFTPGDFVDAATGQFSDDFPDDVVYFDGAAKSGLNHVTEVPTLGEDGRSITLVYDEYFVDWEIAFQVGLPAHIVGEHALKVTGEGAAAASAAKAAVISAIVGKQPKQLAALSRSWNSDFNLTAMPKDTSLLVSSGPFTITGIAQGESVTLTANPRYTGTRQPHFETVIARTITDPLEAVTALRDGEVDIITPSATTDVVAALTKVSDATVVRGAGGMWEHLDLQVAGSRNGYFADPLVRQAFLAVVPRQKIIDELIAPLQDDARVRSSFVFMPGADAYDETIETNGSSAYSRVDVARARALLAEAGANSPEVCILFDAANPRRVDEYELIQESAALAGFVVTDCSKPDWDEFLGVPGEYDAALFGWNTTNLAASAPAAILHSRSDVTNFTGYANPAVDALLAELATLREEKDRDEVLAEVDSLVWADAFGVPLYQFPAITAVSTAIENVTLSPLAPGVMWNLWEWKPTTAQ